MNAIVLAAGVGSRLSPYTDSCPKPMLEVGGQPIIAYNLAMLAAGGFTDVVINVHHLPEVITEYVGSGKRWGLNVSYSEEPELLGTAGALLPVIDRFSAGTFAIVFGDNVNDLDLKAMLGTHVRLQADATIAVWQRDEVSQSGVCDIDSNNRVLRFIEKPVAAETASHWINAGVILAGAALTRAIPRARASDLGREVLPRMLVAGANVYAYRMSGRHWWFDRIGEYEAASKDPGLPRLCK